MSSWKNRVKVHPQAYPQRGSRIIAEFLQHNENKNKPLQTVPVCGNDTNSDAKMHGCDGRSPESNPGKLDDL